METLPKPAGVIVADDDPLIRSVLKRKLEEFGQTVFQASNGSEAVSLAEAIDASLIILDVKMPRLDGFQACAQIRNLPGYDQTPIVMLTFQDNRKAQTFGIPGRRDDVSRQAVRDGDPYACVITISADRRGNPEGHSRRCGAGHRRPGFHPRAQLTGLIPKQVAPRQSSATDFSAADLVHDHVLPHPQDGGSHRQPDVDLTGSHC